MFFTIAFIIFFFNVSLEFIEYKKFTKNEIYHTSGTILNIYSKETSTTLKVKTKNFTFYTKYEGDKTPIIFQNIDLYIISKNIQFLSYLKGFYANSFNHNVSKTITSNRENVYNYIKSQHTDDNISSLYSALFIATPLSPNIRNFSNELGISHLIAISGFHLGIISIIIYFLFNFIYNKIHSNYLPYRNKKFDIMILTSLFLLLYVFFLDMPSSLLRAFVMFIFAFFLLRNNIKVLSFETLLIISIFIIAFFPKLLFSLSLWFSIAGVFYIFLFIKYFSNLNKFVQFFLFNIWIYLAINPVTHYFFATTSLEQLYSPIISALFSLFYPLSAITHIFNIGGLFDSLLTDFISMDIDSIQVLTKDWFFIVYILISLLSITSKRVFLILNSLILGFNIWLFQFIL